MERERRFVAVEDAEVRASTKEDGTVGIGGLGIVFDKPAVIGRAFEEIIRAESVDGLLGADVRGLFNHDPNYVLGRNGVTMTLRKTAAGVEFDIPALPKARADVAEAIQRRDVTGNSFSFTLPEDGSGEVWTRAEKRKDGGKLPLREIVRIAGLYDIGPVTFPAYEATKVSARSMERAGKDALVATDRSGEVEVEREKMREA